MKIPSPLIANLILSSSLNPAHERVSPYAQKLRITLGNDDLDKFVQYCKIAELPSNIVFDCRGKSSDCQVEAAGHGIFTTNRLYRLRKEFKLLDWKISFQLELLLHNCILHTGELESIIPHVKKLSEENSPEYIAGLLRKYREGLQSPIRPLGEDAKTCFDSTVSEFKYSAMSLSRNYFSCCHVTFAPTRLILEGPYPVQSNRIIRHYEGHEVRIFMLLHHG